MIREIKFRFWLGHTKKMTYEHSLIDISHAHWDFTEDIIPLQFTGLIDKNGTEIYEGDMVQHYAWNYPFEIIFNQEKARFVCKLKTGLTCHIDYSNLVVIGNIFQGCR